MAADRRMPLPEDVRDMFKDLLGKPVAATKRKIEPFDVKNVAYVTGLYVSTDDELIGACVTELPLAASAGAALAMIPVVVARESVRAGKLDGGLRENYYEVVNIVSAMLNGPTVPHLRLTDLVDGIPDEVVALAKQAAGLRHYDVTIVGYDGGVLALIAG
jgi:hypothetical protein